MGASMPGNPFYCGLIDSTPNGSISGATYAGGGYLLQKEFNLGLSIVSGIDLNVNDKWQIPSGWGSLVTAFNGAWLQHSTNTPYPGAPTFDCAGLFGNTCATGTWVPSTRTGGIFCASGGDAMERAVLGAVAFHRPDKLRQQFDQSLIGWS